MNAQGSFLLEVIGSDEDLALVRASASISSLPLVLQHTLSERIGDETGRGPDVAVLGAAVQRPLSVARKIRLSSPHTQIVFLLPLDRLERFRAALPFVPHLASAWTADSASDHARLATVLSDAASTSRRSGDSAALLGRINQQLALRGREAAEARGSQLAISERYLATILTQSPDAFVAVDAAGTVVAFNDAAVTLFGAGLSSGEPLTPDRLPEDDRATLRDAVGRAARGETLFGLDVLLRAPSGELGHAELSLAPVHDEHGDVASVSITARDVTERKEAEERQRLLVGELNHRVKNTLAIVRAIAHQSFKGDLPTAEQRATFASRIDALAAAHDLLTERYWKAASLADIVASTLHACGADGESVQALGPPLVLPPQSAVSMAIALHELCTNAIKYGALSTTAGRVRVEWSLEDGPDGERFRMEWLESGGPVVQAPNRRGFGLAMLERGLAGTLSGTVSVEFAETGVVCHIEAPLPVIKDQIDGLMQTLPAGQRTQSVVTNRAPKRVSDVRN